MKILILLFAVLFVAIDARLFEGQCRDRPAPIVCPFNYKLYLGIWYEVSTIGQMKERFLAISF